MTKPLEQMAVEELRNIQAHECGDPITVLGEAKNGEQELRAFDELASRLFESERRNKLLDEALEIADDFLRATKVNNLPWDMTSAPLHKISAALKANKGEP